jgi:agmatine deiminase
MMTKRSFISSSLATMTGVFTSLSQVKAESPASARAAGFHMPLESEPHERTFMQWPALKSIYGNQDDLDAVREKIALIASTIAKFEPVVLLARPEQAKDAKAWVKNGVEVWPLAVQDLWCRDSGPTFVVNSDGDLAASELGFNGWGDKQQHDEDSQIARLVAKQLGLTVFDNGIKGEGGGVETDGAGTLLAQCGNSGRG